MPEKEKKLIEMYYGVGEALGIEHRRHKMFQDTFFLCTLSSSTGGIACYDGSTSDDSDTKSPTETKQKLLHLLATECRLATSLHAGKYAIVCSDFEWFGPSLPHASILTVLEFFGVTPEWLNFFKKWLAAPLRFADGSDNSQVRIR